MELHLGIMKNKELAQWFGIAEKSFTNNRSKKLEELEFFADFNIIRGGVEITNIKKSIYMKNAQRTQELLERTFLEEWNKNNLDTCSNVSKKIYKKYKDEISVNKNSLRKYVGDIRKDNFGIPFVSDGKLGSCRYLWAKAIPIDEKNGIYICERLTEEEEKKKDELLVKYFATKNASEVEKKVIIKEMVERGEITESEAYRLVCNLDGLTELGFRGFLTDLKAAIGYGVIKTTELFVGEYLHEEQMLLKEGEFNFKEKGE